MIKAPSRVEVSRRLGLPVRTVNYSIEPDAENGGWRVRSVTLPPGVWNYASLVSALVRAEYSADAVEAITANLLADPASEEALREHAAFTAHRNKMKALARELMEN